MGNCTNFQKTSRKLMKVFLTLIKLDDDLGYEKMIGTSPSFQSTPIISFKSKASTFSYVCSKYVILEIEFN